jgi:hypothetical protein
VSSRLALRGGLTLARTDGAAQREGVSSRPRARRQGVRKSGEDEFRESQRRLRLVSGGRRCSPCDWRLGMHQFRRGRGAGLVDDMSSSGSRSAAVKDR